MNVQEFIFLGTIVLFLILLLVLMWFKHKDILSYFFPEKYVVVEMLELDNNVNRWVQVKNPDLKFDFNSGKYNMYHQGIKDATKRNPAIYRDGRLAKFYYYEGEADPLDLRLEKASSNPQLSQQIESLQFSRIFDDDKTPIQNFIEKYLIWIIVGIIAIMFFSGGG